MCIHLLQQLFKSISADTFSCYILLKIPHVGYHHTTIETLCNTILPTLLDCLPLGFQSLFNILNLTYKIWDTHINYFLVFSEVTVTSLDTSSERIKTSVTGRTLDFTHTLLSGIREQSLNLLAS